MYTKVQIANVIAKTKSLLNDIEAMQGDAADWYSGFSMYEVDWTEAGDVAAVEWPNLSISYDELTAAIRELES